MEDIPEDHSDTLPITGTWSVRQVVCHLADAEIVYADRMKRVLIRRQFPLSLNGCRTICFEMNSADTVTLATSSL